MRLALLAVPVLVLASLAGCGSSATPEECRAGIGAIFDKLAKDGPDKVNEQTLRAEAAASCKGLSNTEIQRIAQQVATEKAPALLQKASVGAGSAS
jgi:hypothetical protein